MPTTAVRDSLTKLSATGWEWTDNEGIVIANSLKPPGALRYLYEYLLASCFIVPVKSEAAVRTPPFEAAT
jgi:hypothetical protein